MALGPACVSDLTDITRKLVAVFAADVEGYSRLMGVDEVGTLKGLTERRAILDRMIGEHRGRITNAAGDSVLAEFGSAVDAVSARWTRKPRWPKRTPVSHLIVAYPYKRSHLVALRHEDFSE
jgi:class 3 adenylate cyclase